MLGAIGATIAHSTGGPNEQLVSQDRVYGGGGTDAGACFDPDIGFCRKFATNLGIDAHASGSDEEAYGDVSGGAVGFAESHGQITCLRVHGHNAVVGGITVSSSDPSAVGLAFITWYVDRGTPAFGDRDQESPTYSIARGTGPPGFPYACPSPDAGLPTLDLFRSFVPIAEGDIVVQDGSEDGNN
jgi:hypothetical protein